MDILKDLAQTGRKIITDTKTPKNTAPVGKKVASKVAEPEAQILNIHQAFVKRAIKDKPSKKEIVEFFQRVCEAEEKKL
jgi:hypothetical protein